MGDTSSSLALAEAAQTMGLLSILVLAIAFITVALAFLGSFDTGRQYLATGFISTILAIVVYAGAVSYTLSNLCQGSPTCPSGPIGSAFADGASVTWGFQTGFPGSVPIVETLYRQMLSFARTVPIQQPANGAIFK